MEIIRQKEYMDIVDGRECRIVIDKYITDSGKVYNCKNVYPVHTPEEEARIERNLGILKMQIIRNIQMREQAEAGA